MRKLAYFVHDWADAAIERRIEGLARDGVEVSGFAMSRGRADRPDWVVADLGETRDNAYLHRICSIWTGARRAMAARAVLQEADVILARNLDMLGVAFLARRIAGIKTPVIYECLDIHRLMIREDGVGWVLRGTERWLMKDCAALWISSPAFLLEYFEPRYGACVGAALVENRMAAAPGLADRPASIAPIHTDRPLRLGWFGNLRCARSLRLIEELGDRFAGRLEISLRGYPALGEIPDFEARIVAAPSIAFGGRYRWPDDLGAIYDDVDLVWAGDFMDEGFNSAWLLPNRLYEGGWFACPAIAPAASETGNWIAERGTGFTVQEPLDRTLPALIEDLLEDPSRIAAAASKLAALPDDTFLQPDGALAGLISEALDRAKARHGIFAPG